MKTFGQVGYDAYVNFAGGKSLITGQPLPKWDELPGDVKSAWEAAGGAIVSEVETRKVPV